jgi:hypothetical protein
MLWATCPGELLFPHDSLFLTLRARVAYTKKFATGRGSGQWGTFYVAAERELAAIAYYKGGLLCQSAHFSRGAAAARRLTVSVHG